MTVPCTIQKKFSRGLAEEQWLRLWRKSVREDAGRPDSGRIASSIIESSSGYPSFLSDQKPIHSRHDPVGEAFRHLKRITVRNDEQLVLFFGAGLGYVIRLFLDLRPNPCIWFESDPDLLFAALGVNDFRNELEGRLLIRTVLPDEKFLEERLSGRRNRDVEFYVQESTHKANPFYGRSKFIIERYLNRKDVNVATLTRFDRSWASNIIKNFYHLSSAKPVSLLFDRFAGMTALICGAGPSLSESMAEIATYRDRLLLIAVDTALIPLRAAGIDPDITVTVDPQPLNRKYIEGYEGESLFVCDPTTSYLSLRLIPENRIYYYRSPFKISEIFFRNLKRPAGDIAFGGSVSTNAYDLAVRLGCRNILLAGQDLSFTQGLAHVKGAVLEEALNLKESRIFRRELHNHRQLHALPQRALPSLEGGEPVLTNDKLKIFYEWFNSRFYSDCVTGLHIVNCTKRGARFEHIDHAGIDVCEGFLHNGISPSEALKAIHTGLCGESFFDRDSFGSDLRSLIDELEAILPDLERAESLSLLMLELIRESPEDGRISAIIGDLEGIDSVLRSKPNLSELISGIMQKALTLIDSGGAGGIEESRSALLTAKKSAILYSELRRGCGDYLRWLRHSMRLFSSRSI